MSLNGRLWGLRILALTMATMLWFFGTLETREQESEKVVEASVTYSTPRGLILLDPVQRVKVRLRGRTSKVRSLNPLAVDVLVSLGEGRSGQVDVTLGAENVIVPEDIEVVSIEPNQLELRLDREVTQTLPVKFKLMGEPAAGARVQEVEVSPDRVQVSGPESRLRSIQWLTTIASSLPYTSLKTRHLFPLAAHVSICPWLFQSLKSSSICQRSRSSTRAV